MERETSLPVWIQLAREIGREIVSGVHAPGERLPSVRELAQTMRVNPNTLQRSLAELERTGLIFTERTNGKYVTEDHAVIAAARKAMADALAEDYLHALAAIGYDVDHAIMLIRKEERL